MCGVLTSSRGCSDTHGEVPWRVDISRATWDGARPSSRVTHMFYHNVIRQCHRGIVEAEISGNNGRQSQTEAVFPAIDRSSGSQSNSDLDSHARGVDSVQEFPAAGSRRSRRCSWGGVTEQPQRDVQSLAQDLKFLDSFPVLKSSELGIKVLLGYDKASRRAGTALIEPDAALLWCSR